MRYQISFLIFLLAVGCVSSQAVQAPMVGGGFDNLYQIIENNTLQSRQTSDKVENLYGKIQETMTSWTGNIIFANSLFMILIYLVIVFVDKRNKKLKRKTYEDYIKDMETKADIKAKENIKTLSDLNEKTNYLLSNIGTFIKLIEDRELTKDNKKLTETYFKRGFTMGIAYGLIILVIYKILAGV